MSSKAKQKASKILISVFLYFIYSLFNPFEQFVIRQKQKMEYSLKRGWRWAMRKRFIQFIRIVGIVAYIIWIPVVIVAPDWWKLVALFALPASGIVWMMLFWY
jgi:hypothetical protein